MNLNINYEYDLLYELFWNMNYSNFAMKQKHKQLNYAAICATVQHNKL